MGKFIFILALLTSVNALAEETYTKVLTCDDNSFTVDAYFVHGLGERFQFVIRNGAIKKYFEAQGFMSNKMCARGEFIIENLGQTSDGRFVSRDTSGNLVHIEPYNDKVKVWIFGSRGNNANWTFSNCSMVP